MTDGISRADVVSQETLALARRRRATRRLAERLQRISAATVEIREALGRLHRFLDYQHRHFQDLIARSDDVQRFCSRCQDIMDGDDADRMARQRDWLIAGYRRRNAHRRDWLDRLGLPR